MDFSNFHIQMFPSLRNSSCVDTFLEATPEHKQVSCGGFVIQTHEKFKLCRNQWLITLVQNKTLHTFCIIVDPYLLKAILIVIYVMVQHMEPLQNFISANCSVEQLEGAAAVKHIDRGLVSVRHKEIEWQTE